MKTRTVRFFDQAALNWDKNVKPSRHQIERLLDSLGAFTGKKVLDIGCGTGVLFLPILERIGAGGHLTGLDPSGEMLGMARRNCSDPRVVLVQGFAESMPFAEGDFDTVVIFSCYPHLYDPPKAIKECLRVLAEKGRLLIGHASGRAHINRLHREIGGDVADHLLDPARSLADNLISSGFEVDSVVDEEDIYYITGTKKTIPEGLS